MNLDLTPDMEAMILARGLELTLEDGAARFVVPGRDGTVVVGLKEGVLNFFPVRSSGHKAVLGALGYLD